jgi:SAM-dependent MidA family methyltransferase
MNPLREKIIETINRKGPVTFETFMEMSLYYPELGYYTSPGFAIGRRGDFYTSSHLHPIFGAMLARQLIEMWEQMGTPSSFQAVEMGGGAGYLCRDIFSYLFKRSQNDKKLSNFFKSLSYVIVEINSDLQKRQKELLGEFAEHVKWITSLNEFSHKIYGCIFSNELIDAFPVHIVEMRDALREVYVDYANNDFIECVREVRDTRLIKYLSDFSITLSEGYRTEVNLRIRDWLKEISTLLSEGYLFTIDYGYSSKEYYNEERPRGTLLCYFNHKYNENPYKNIGSQDITAHVNFSSLKQWGEEFGLNTVGYAAQGAFLISSGIDDLLREFYHDSADYSSEISKIKSLILPQGLGESHKVMIQHKGKGLPELRGFEMQNRAGRL